jgi:membrane protease YdiL (CAAX protease family)
MQGGAAVSSPHDQGLDTVAPLRSSDIIPVVEFSARQRIALTLAIVALYLAISPLNLELRIWLRDRVIRGMPYWLDKMTTMCALSVAVWGTIGGLLLGRSGLSLRSPVRPREAWLVAIGSGIALVALGAGAFALHGRLEWGPHIDWPGIAADVVSNFWEELIGRGAILGLLLLVLGRDRTTLAMVLSGALFCRGHLYHPPAMLLLTFLVGTFWSWTTVRYRSLWPGYVSHTVVDIVGGSLLK